MWFFEMLIMEDIQALYPILTDGAARFKKRAEESRGAPIEIPFGVR